MSDRRHQRGFPRAENNRRIANLAAQVFGKWTFYKMNLSNNRTETITEGRAQLEIKNKKFPNIMAEKNSAKIREFINFEPIADLKCGQKIEVAGHRYWATFTPPASELEQAAA